MPVKRASKADAGEEAAKTKRISKRSARARLRSDIPSKEECYALAQYCWLKTLEDACDTKHGWKREQWETVLETHCGGYDLDRFERLHAAYSLLEFKQEVVRKGGGLVEWDVTLARYLFQNCTDCRFFDRLYGVREWNPRPAWW